MTREKASPVRKREARILDVDPERFTCRVQHVRGENPADEIPAYSPYIANRGGGWMGALPEPGDFVAIERGENSQSWNITGYKPLPRAEVPNEVDAATSTHKSTEPRSNYAAGRAPVRPGDMGMWGSAGNRVVVRRSGVTEVLADEITWSRYFSREHTIRHSAATVETQGVFGVHALYTLRDEAREAAGATPTGFSSWIKSHAEAAPLVNVEMGAVLEDEKLRLPGVGKRHNRREGTVVARFLVFDQAYADRYAALGRPPDPAGARLAVRADENGNTQWAQTGNLTQSLGGVTQYIAGREVRSIEGSSLTQVAGEWAVEAAGSSRLSASQQLLLSSGGDLVLECARFVVRADNDHIQTRRGYTVEAGGNFSVQSAARASLRAAGDVLLSAGRGMGTTVGGRYQTDVLGSADIENAGRDVTAWGVKVHRGKAKLRATTGSFEISIGPDVAPLALIKLHADPRVPTQVGRIQIGFPLTNTGLTVSPDGSFELTGPAGGIKCDAAGRIQLGQTSAPTVGHLISTLTHPVCFVTGAPILGHSTLLASPSPPLPFTGSPSLGVQPPTQFLPDEVAS